MIPIIIPLLHVIVYGQYGETALDIAKRRNYHIV